MSGFNEDENSKPPPIWEYLKNNVMKVAVPFIWALTENKTQSLYDKLFEFIKLKVAKSLKPTIIVCDFEKGLQNSLKATFPEGVRKRGKRLHIFRKFKDFNTVKKSKITLYMQKLYNIPLMPANFINLSFNILAKEIEDDNEIAADLRPLLNYMRKYWIRKINPQVLSAYNSKGRTNNVIERYHRYLKEVMGRHPPFCRFISRMQEDIDL
ncbi:uncharacterized protein [Prorops nasuta]|uniref:uncharacterized protein n=1 Tax=Prorops nasuta TaxID=863751 RepID=UPI0034CD52C1